MRAVSCLLLLCLAYIAHAQHRAADCRVDIWRVDSRHEPVLSADGMLLLPDPEKGQLVISSGSVMLAGCPGAGNQLKLGKGLQHVNVTCTSGGTLEVSGKPVMADDLWCQRRSKPSARRTRRRCGSAGELDVYELGFNVSRRWLPAIEVCHDTKAANTLYSYHLLHGSRLRFRRSATSRPQFSPGSETGTLYQDMSPNDLYKGSAVLETLAAALGSRDKAEELLQQSGVSRGHLAPSGDFLLNTLQHASFFYANAAPQWQTFNAGNWLSVERELRKLARRQSLDLKVWTGTHGVLSLGGSQLYLAKGGRLAVPRFFWKLVQNPRSGTAIAFVGLNNPFATSEEAKEMPCTDVCDKAGWAWRNCRRPNKRGFVICCSAQELTAAVPGAPKVNATKLLLGPIPRHAAGA